MDKKDEIILQQLDVIRTMTQNNLNRMGSDFWGAPLTPDAPKSTVPKEVAPKANAPKSADGAKPNKPAASTGADEKKEEEAPLPPPEKIEDLKKELDTYIGLGEVKREVNNLINMATVFKRREETGLPNADFSLHMVFTGNPGTGKTMIARLMARVYRSLGILSKGQLVEVDRSGLVAGYVVRRPSRRARSSKRRSAACCLSTRPTHSTARATTISVRRPSTRCSRRWRITATTSS